MARPIVLLPGAPASFPDPNRANADGLLAIGGDLSVDRLLAAYDSGIFPWYEQGVPPLWWSPDPRTILDARELHVSRSLRRRLRQEDFELTFDRDFEGVIVGCAEERDHGTWIIPEMLDAFVRLHRQGHAHSFEVWMEGELAGGLYGVHHAGLFAAESMFHRRTDASKIALCAAVNSLFARGITLFDVQFLTSHLAAFGARSIPRREYLERLAQARRQQVDLAGVDPWDGVKLCTHFQ